MVETDITKLAADLYSHSYYSDGLLSPREVVRRACGRGVKILALTDHNSVGGIKEAIEEGDRFGMRIVPATEMVFNGGEVLGYFIDLRNPLLVNFLSKVRESSLRKTKYYCSVLSKNYDISFEKVQRKFPYAGDNLNNLHVAYYLYEQKIAGSLKEVWKIIFNKVPFLNFSKPSLEEIIRVIVASGGVPVLAHPWISKTSRELINDRRIRELVRLGLKGIEIDQGDRREERSEEFLNLIKSLAAKYNLVLTSGSDFHGDFLIDRRENNSNHELGAHNCSEEVIEKIYSLSGTKQKVLDF